MTIILTGKASVYQQINLLESQIRLPLIIETSHTYNFLIHMECQIMSLTYTKTGCGLNKFVIYWRSMFLPVLSKIPVSKPIY